MAHQIPLACSLNMNMQVQIPHTNENDHCVIFSEMTEKLVRYTDKSSVVRLR